MKIIEKLLAVGYMIVVGSFRVPVSSSLLWTLCSKLTPCWRDGFLWLCLYMSSPFPMTNWTRDWHLLDANLLASLSPNIFSESYNYVKFKNKIKLILKNKNIKKRKRKKKVTINYFILWLLKYLFIFIKVHLIYNIILASGIQHSDSMFL